MGFSKVILFSILFAFVVCSSSEALNFIVGGKNGWSVHPSESYSHWATRLRFQVNDTLTFKYNKETDSVVVVTKNDYEKCNGAKPIQKMDGGDSIFKFDRSGPFYFITGNQSNCEHGQKFIIVVLAVRDKSPVPPTPSVPAPSPSSHVPAVSPAPVISTPAVSPAPVISTPVVSPAPVISGPAVSPAPVISGPAADAPGIVHTPSPGSPWNTPSPAGMDWSPAPAPSKSFSPAISPAMVVTAVLSFTVAAFIAFN